MKLWQVQLLVTLRLATISGGKLRMFWQRSDQPAQLRYLRSIRARRVTPFVYYCTRVEATGSSRVLVTYSRLRGATA